MKTNKQKIIDILWKCAEDAHYAGSCGELGDSFKAINSDSFEDVADNIMAELTNLPQSTSMEDVIKRVEKKAGTDIYGKQIVRLKDVLEILRSTQQ